MAVITFDVAAFRLQFPAFSDSIIYPDDTLQMYWDTGICFISNQDYGYLNGNSRARALNMMTAHLTALAGIVATGNTPGIVTSATIDKVSVSMTPPPNKTQLQYWLNLTAYGQQLLALLTIKAAPGLYVGGFPERQAFRRSYGAF